MEKEISDQILKEIRQRLSFLINVGLSYLTLDRSAVTLSEERLKESGLLLKLDLN